MSEGRDAPQSLAELVDVRATRFDRKVLYHYVDSGEQWTFADLPRRAGRVAGQLAKAGVAAGARVGVLTEDRRVFCDAFFGLQHLGAVPVPLGVGGRPGSESWTVVLRDRVTRFGLVAVATDPATASALGPVLDPARAVPVDGATGNVLAPRPVSEIAFVQPSSGTTGEPKGIVITQRAVLANLAAIGEQWALDDADSGLSWLPLFHDMGLVGTVISSVFNGATLHQWPTASFLRSPGRWISLVGELGVTVAVAPPFALELVTRRWQRRAGAADLSRLRHLLVGAEQIRPHTIEAFAATFESHGLRPDALCPTYGLAEATLAVTAKPLGTRVRTVGDGRHRWVSCGAPLPGVQVRTSDAGELLVRTPGAMAGYLADPDASAAAMQDGWLRTGDAVTLVDGEVVVVGRLKEMINRGGQRVAAADFELAAQGVEGVLPDRVVAFGEPGAAGERVVLLAESRAGGARAGEIVLALRARLADAGLPADVVELVRPGFVPRTTSGKLRRGAARERWRASAARRGRGVVAEGDGDARRRVSPPGISQARLSRSPRRGADT